jgi:DNA-binding Xre family transcriptional regulator
LFKILFMGRSFMKFKKPIPKNAPPVDFVELDKHLDDCSFIVSRFMKNVKFLLKRRKSNFNKMITYYRGFGIRVSKSYLSELNSGKTRTCNLLILQFLASYLGMSVADLISYDYTLVDKEEEIVDGVESF